MKIKKLALLIIAIFCFCGCSYEDLADKLIPEAESEYAKDFLQKIQDRDFEYVKSQIDAELIGDVTDEKLLEIAEYFPTGELISVEIIGSQTHTFNSQWQGNFSFEYQFSDGWAVANTAMKQVDGKPSVIGFNVYRTTASQRDLTAFSAAELTPIRIILLLLTVLIPAFMIFTCYKVYKTPIPVKKKRWYFFSVLGIFGFSFNWTTGVLNYQLATVKLLGVGVVAAGPHAPWILSFTLPLGAVVFWVKRKKLMEQLPVNDTNEAVGEPSSE